MNYYDIKLLLKNEYEKYIKNGFLFEPLKVNTKSNNSAATSNLLNPNVSFGSDLISPYRGVKDNHHSTLATIILKNPVDNDQLLDVARGVTSANSIYQAEHINHTFVNNTEFRNYNYLKSLVSDTNTQPITSFNSDMTNSCGNNKKNRRSMNRRNQIETIAGASACTNQVHANNDYEKMYEDEYDLANKYTRKSSSNLS